MIMVAELLGVVGVVAITATYFLLSTERMNADDWAYPVINFIGASFIIWSLTIEWNLSAFLMETSWAAISLYGVVKTYKKARKVARV
jgi:paired small multidrug resistance pump